MEIYMDVSLILKVAGIGLTVSIAYQLLARYGRDEQAVLVSLSGIIIIMLMLMDKLSALFAGIRATFGL